MSLDETFRRYGFRRTLVSLKWQTELPLETPLPHRLRLLKGGFGAASLRTYGLERDSPRDYLSDLASGCVRTRRSNGPFAVSLFSDKLLSHALLGPHIALPDLLALVERGRLYPFRESTVADVNSLLRYCEGVGSVILKPS